MQRFTWPKAVAVALVAGGLALTPLIVGAQSDFAPPNELTLNNDIADNFTTGEGKCLNVPALDPAKSYWHFILTKEGFDFTEIWLNVGGNLTGYSWVTNGGKEDNVFVEVPAGATLLSLSVDGSFARFTPDATDKVGEVMNFTLSHTCTGTGDTEETPPAVTVEKTADPDWTRTWTWTVDKELVSGPEAVYENGKLIAGRFTYMVSSERSLLSDELTVTGTITITNDNDTEATITSVGDELPGFGCEVDDIAGTTVTKTGGPVTAEYTCTASGEPTPGEYLNTATANWTWVSEAGETYDGADGTKAIEFSAAPDHEIDATSTLADDRYPGVVADTPYTIDVPLTVDNCTTGFTNTASVAGDNSWHVLDEDDVTVTVCRTIGGRTIGFWSNKNGGAATTAARLTDVIADYPNVLNVSPFKEKVVKTIQSYLLKATCSSDCITMFRAQFYATAMNVLFLSDKGYGDQYVSVPEVANLVGAGECITLSTALDNIDDWFGANSGHTADVTAVKTFLDDLNQDIGNALQCNP